MEPTNGKTHLFDPASGAFTRCGRSSDFVTTTQDLAAVTCGRCIMLHSPRPRVYATPAPNATVQLAPGRDALALHIARHVAYGFAPDQEMLASFRATDVYGPGDGA